MIGIIGTKMGMTQIVNEIGQQIPCTVIVAEPNPVVQMMETSKAGRASVTLGHGTQRLRRASKAKERTPGGGGATRAGMGQAQRAGAAAQGTILRPPKPARSCRRPWPRRHCVTSGW